MKIQSTNVNFLGVKFPYRTNAKDAKKIADFIENKNNFDLIQQLNSAGIDIYFSDNITKIGFAHQQYGHLDKYGAENVFADEFSSESENILQAAAKAAKKVQKAWAGAAEKNRRGC